MRHDKWYLQKRSIFFFKIPFLTSYWWSWEHCPNVNHWFLAAGHSFTTLLTSQQASVFHKHTYYYFSLHISNDCSALHKWQNTRIFDFHFLELYFWTVTTYRMPKNTSIFFKNLLQKIFVILRWLGMKGNLLLNLKVTIWKGGCSSSSSTKLDFGFLLFLPLCVDCYHCVYQKTASEVTNRRAVFCQSWGFPWCNLTEDIFKECFLLHYAPETFKMWS